MSKCTSCGAELPLFLASSNRDRGTDKCPSCYFTAKPAMLPVYVASKPQKRGLLKMAMLAVAWVIVIGALGFIALLNLVALG